MARFSRPFPRRWFNAAATDHTINSIGGLALDLVELRIPVASAVALLQEQASSGTCRSAARLLSLARSGAKEEEVVAAGRLLKIASKRGAGMAVDSFIDDPVHRPVTGIPKKGSPRALDLEGIGDRMNGAF